VSLPPSLGFERPRQNLSVEWIRANIDAALAAFALGLAAYGVRQLLGIPDPNAGILAKALLLITEVAAAAAGLFIYAVRTGAVLGQKLPAFPPLTWNALHVLIGVVIGAYIAFGEMDGGDNTRFEAPETSLVMSIAMGGAVAGALIGAVLGSLQALVLRKAVRHVAVWIRWSTLAGTTFAAYALVLYVGFEQTFTTEIMTQLISFGVAVVAGVVMLPALHSLTAR